METVRVNMTPDNEVKTIHCSQNDGKTRKWGFELYKEDGIIPASSISPQMFFDVYKGGTEQILPENGSEPTTSPIIADIQYPDVLRSEQEFLYRKSPTQADGKAKITKIKGNTLVWNQLVQNGNFADTSNWTASNSTFSVANNIASILARARYGHIFQYLNIISGHKYFLCGDVKLTTYTSSYGQGLDIRWNNVSHTVYPTSNNWEHLAEIVVSDYTGQAGIRVVDNRPSGWDTIQAKYVMIFDLTSMGIDSLTTTSEVEAWLSSHIGNLPYFAYDSGSLLSFNGTGIKTTGKNLARFWKLGYYNASGVYVSNTIIDVTYPIRLEQGQTVTITCNYGSTFKSHAYCLFTDFDGTNLTGYITRVTTGLVSYTYTATQDCWLVAQANLDNLDMTGRFYTEQKEQIEFGSTATTYEPYTSNTLSLPTLTYFSSGMKSAGSVYDELTESKAITRIGSRAYQSGDESDTSVITDGTTTYYALTTPTETTINTVSLVSEQAEIPLYEDDDMLIGECTTQLSSKSGFIPTKIKYQDDNGIAYSQKINLHVEN